MTKKILYSLTEKRMRAYRWLKVLKDANVAACFGLYVIKHPGRDPQGCRVQLLPHTGQLQESHHVTETRLSVLVFR